MNTKEMILLASLKLFAREGYEGVSVRDIANQIGISQAALYKHYASKQDIFDSIVQHMNEDYKKRVVALAMPDGSAVDMAAEYKTLSLEDIVTISKAQFTYWTQDEYGCCFRKLLQLERYRNTEMEELYQQHFGSAVISYMTSLFEEMIHIGIFRAQNPRVLAYNFYGPIYLMMSLYKENSNKQEILALLEEHIEQFNEKYGEAKA